MVIPYYVTTHPPAIQKQHSREAHIELPLSECEGTFRIRGCYTQHTKKNNI
jgi:hypothetical protein